MVLLEGGLSLLALVVVIIIGLILLAVLVKILLFIIIPGIMALVVWWMTNDPVLTGLTFLVVAVLTIIFRR